MAGTAGNGCSWCRACRPSLLGVIIYFYLQDKPADAHWLIAGREKPAPAPIWNTTKRISKAKPKARLGQMFRDPKVYLLALVYFLLLGATYTMVFWVPTLIQSWGVKDLLLIGLYSAIAER